MSFLEWLLAQTARTDPIGEVARRLLADRTCLRASCPHPTNARNHRGLRRHLAFVHAARAEDLAALDHAHCEYRRAYPRRRRSDCLYDA